MRASLPSGLAFCRGQEAPFSGVGRPSLGQCPMLAGLGSLGEPQGGGVPKRGLEN